MGNSVNNAAGTSLESTGSSGVIAGDWGTLAGPTITSVTADDADNLDAVYGNGDTITVVFSEATNQPAAGTQAQIDAIFSFNESLGADYTGSWSAADTLVITVVDDTGATPPTIGGLVLTFQVGNSVNNAAGTSLESTGSSGVIAGDWGTLAGPTVTSVTADDPDNLDAVYGNGDTITVVFSEATNQPCGRVRRRRSTRYSVLMRAWGDYTGSWSAADTLVITVSRRHRSDAAYDRRVSLTFQVGNSVKNAAGTSLESTGTLRSDSGRLGYVSRSDGNECDGG